MRKKTQARLFPSLSQEGEQQHLRLPSGLREVQAFPKGRLRTTASHRFTGKHDGRGRGGHERSKVLSF